MLVYDRLALTSVFASSSINFSLILRRMQYSMVRYITAYIYIFPIMKKNKFTFFMCTSLVNSHDHSYKTYKLFLSQPIMDMLEVLSRLLKERSIAF